MAFDPARDIDQAFWDFIDRIGGDEDQLQAALMTMEKAEIVRHFDTYKDAQTEFAFKVSQTVSDASEDVLDDLADSVVALGRRQYIQLYSGQVELPPRDRWEGMRRLIHVFDSVYYDRFNEVIWDEID